MSPPSNERLVDAFNQFEAVAAEIRAALLGARVDVLPGGWTDKALQGIEKRALDLEWALRRFRVVEVQHQAFDPPPIDRLADQAARSRLN